jgi:hypothetical protein
MSLLPSMPVLLIAMLLFLRPQDAAAAPSGGRPAARDLRPAAELAAILAIRDRAARSRALFLEASRVLLHPRCRNCHPSGDTPLQGTAGRAHDPPVARGPDDHGVVGMRCAGCHQDHNLQLARVPGAPSWALAPLAMAWANKSPQQLCEQLKDPRRNGGRTLAAIAEHGAHDPLVAWGWAPGADREPAPGTQAAFGALLRGWIDSGAVCPEGGDRP